MSDRLYKVLREADDVFKAPDPVDIALRYLRSFTKEARPGRDKYVIENPDGSFDVEGDLYIMKAFVVKKKVAVKFRKVHGSLYVNDIGYAKSAYVKLNTLENFPEEITGHFYCFDAQLRSLKGCPKKVGGNFKILGNKVKFTEEQVRALCAVHGSVSV